jgi:hypothetical protein
MAGMAAQAGGAGVRNGFERIGAAGVFGQAAVGKVQFQRFGVVDHVFHHGAEAVGGGVDLRLGLGREIDGLGVAAAFKVEDATVGPAMFVIADQRAVGRGGERGLAGAGQAEEHGGVDRVAGGVVRRAMHRHHALGGQEVVQDGEDRLLVFPRIGGVGDQHGLFVEVQHDGGFGAAAMAGRIGLERRAVDHRPFGGEAVQLGPFGAAQKVADENPCQASSVMTRTSSR